MSNGEIDKEDDEAPKSRHPRWVRINTIKTTLQEQLSKTFADYRKTDDLSQILVAPRSAKIYYEDPTIPNLLALPAQIDLSRSIAYAKGQIIFQDKASCFPAYLLDPSPDDGDVIDATAAPGNKTTHLAAIAQSRSQSGNGTTIIAFERDRGRTAILQKMIELATTDGIIKVKGGSDFIAAKPDSVEFANVRAILLDPSCSGTGIVGRDDAIKMHLPEAQGGRTALPTPSKGKKRKRGDEESRQQTKTTTLSLEMDELPPEETVVVGKLSDRLTALSAFQLHILTHAMRFVNAHKITYSTCSVHFEENERVVFQALATAVAKERGWRILKRSEQVEGLQKWSRRGMWEDEKTSCALDEAEKREVLDGCIRCDKGTEEGTMGFFVAAFVREGDPDAIRLSDKIADSEDEWHGFEESIDLQQIGQTSDRPALPELGKSRKKKARKRKTVTG